VERGLGPGLPFFFILSKGAPFLARLGHAVELACRDLFSYIASVLV